ncbi:type 2 lantipeptide synthetase LanM family protein [Mesobacillus foraminis]|uniref:type 2 lanthipeptide synthetase LanM family protein n=1 Tax=Mesobacillus foraminis TaxID=279826 RepID=UPI001BECC4A1|nr:type 2 lanthipeptide synthetase LanM family protein [Mesobacillus foraminis]MBT2757892.1 type 2 lantipeptide synthetase LanM family protein [Mesobacillus foraminis]
MPTDQAFKKAFFMEERVQKKTIDGLVHESQPDDYSKLRISNWIDGMGRNEDLFKKNLHLHNMEHKDLLEIMMDKNYDFDPNAEWLTVIREIENFDHQRPELPSILQKIIAFNPNEPITFFNFFLPFLKIGVERIEKAISLTEKKHGRSLMEEKVLFQLVRNLAETLSKVSFRTLTLELNIARLKELLIGETPQERYKYFSDTLLTDQNYIAEVYRQYPVLMRILAGKTVKWADNFSEIYDHLLCDKISIEQRFFNGTPISSVEDITVGISDSHNGGKGVAILKFSNGSSLVYKPRSLEIDDQFQELLHWFNGLNDDKLELRPITLLNRDTYGWSEFVEHKECSTEQEVKNFYYRMGYYLALLYSINAIDFHNENLIACGEHPVLIDLETLFNQDAVQSTDSATAQEIALKTLSQSVLATNILPVFTLYNKAEGRGLNISGMANGEEQLYPSKVPVIQSNHTDEQKVERGYITIPASSNYPTLNGEKVNVTLYIDEMMAGFKEAYGLLASNKDGLKNKVKRFENTRVRQILRATSRYGNLLAISYHPDYLRDGLDREMLLGKLWLDTEMQPELKQVLLAEKEDLLEGDIPYFTTEPGKPHIYDSQGRCYENYYEASSLFKTLEKIDGLGPKDYEEQLQIIKLSMLALGTTPSDKTSGYIPVVPEHPIKREPFLEEAKRIADYLIDRSIQGTNNGQKDVSWIGTRLTDNAESLWRIAPLGNDLYDGISGIALFFGYLYKYTKEPKYRDLVQKCLPPVKDSLRDMLVYPQYAALGAFTGVLSNIYMINHLSVILDEPSLLEEIKEVMPKLIESIPYTQEVDIIDGSAGSLIVCLDLYNQTDEEIFLDAARKFGEQILQKAIPQAKGIGWKLSVSEDALPGFSHGSSGIVWALYELYRLTGEQGLYDSLIQGLVYERSLYMEEKKNWAIPAAMELSQLPCAWCHGAAGVVLSRLLMKKAGYSDALIDDEIRAGLETIIKEGFGRDHSLCHGDLGNLDVLLLASQVLDDKIWEQYGYAVGEKVLKEIQQTGWKSGLPQYLETYGAMVGIAGIGLGLLKLYDIAGVPSLTRLESLTGLK